MRSGIFKSFTIVMTTFINKYHTSAHCEHGVEILILTEWRQNTLKHSTFNADQGSEVQIEFGSAIAL